MSIEKDPVQILNSENDKQVALSRISKLNTQTKDFVIKDSHPVTPPPGQELSLTTSNGMKFKELWISVHGGSVRLNVRLATGDVYMVVLTKV